jgi:hypothetical protein
MKCTGGRTKMTLLPMIHSGPAAGRLARDGLASADLWRGGHPPAGQQGARGGQAIRLSARGASWGVGRDYMSPHYL